MIKIPGQLGWVQANRGDTLGTLKESFNLDLSSNVGRVRTMRSKRIAYTESPTGFGQVGALAKLDTDFIVASEHSAAHDIWIGGNSPFNTLTNDTTSVEINPNNTDMIAWNGGLYLATGNEMFLTTDGASWSEIGTNVLTATDNHLLAALGDFLYVSDQDYKVFNVNKSNTFAGSGSGTLNLALSGYAIQVLMAGLNSLFIGLSHTSGNGPSLVFEWDGTTENSPSARYEVDALGLMAGVVKDGVPYLVDSRGRLLAFNGGAFVEVARFPLNGRSFKGFHLSLANDRAIHPRGMAVDGDEILINVSNRTDDITSDDYNEFPSGVWAWSERNGLYHKLSPSYQAVADTGTTNLTDYGQYRTYSAGPMMVFTSVTEGGDATPTNGGRIVFAMEYFVDADDTSSDTEWGLFTDDTADDTQKAGFLVTSSIDSQWFRDNWQTLYAHLTDLNSGDLVECKYRLQNDTPTYVTATWGGTDRFSTNTDLSSYEQGDEVTIVQGKGAGACAHIRSLSGGAGSEVILDRSITGLSGTSVIRLEKWKKAGTITGASLEGFTIGQQSHLIQIKAYLQWTGPRELHGLTVENAPSVVIK